MHGPSPERAWRVLVACIVLLMALGGAWLWWWRPPADAIEVWCAHDAVYAQEILDGFTASTGIPVIVRYDSEATKSLGLTERLQREGGAACDVFWNNELLGTVALAEAGKLEPYRGSGWQRMPESARSETGLWTGFGARLRVIATAAPAPGDELIAARLRGDLQRCAIAKPLYGTTLTQCAVLWHALGEVGFQAWHDDWRRRGVRVVDGNAASRDLVVAGTVDIGLTDSDDVCSAIAAGKSIAMMPLRLGDIATVPAAAAKRTIAIPNTVAILAGCRHPAAARRLVDHLLSAEVETRLAQTARQIPLGPVDAAQVPAEVRLLQAWAADAFDMRGLLAARESCLRWLKQRYGL